MTSAKTKQRQVDGRGTGMRSPTLDKSPTGDPRSRNDAAIETQRNLAPRIEPLRGNEMESVVIDRLNQVIRALAGRVSEK